MSEQRTETKLVAKPFLKWAGGKSQLLPVIMSAIEPLVSETKTFTYLEPFVGSGAVFFEVMQQYRDKASDVIINDRNEDLMLAYRVLRDKPDELIGELETLKKQYTSSKNDEIRKSLFYKIRDEFNSRKADSVQHASMLIFLNKTCYNGLYRVNSKNHFNVPFGQYKNPGIFSGENLRSISQLLQNVHILNKDFTELISFPGHREKTLVYLDPPYRPISKTASFNAYSKGVFDDAEQRRLKEFCDRLSKNGAYWLLSNSDPKNHDSADTFFDDLYSGYYIERVGARRSINSRASGRGSIKELLISNFKK